MDKLLKHLKESWSLMEEKGKSDSSCYMLYVDKNDEKQFIDLQKDLNLKGELTESGKFHVTIHYVKDNNYEPLVEYLKGKELPKVKGKCRGFSIFGEDNDALVVEIDGKEINNYFEEINNWLTDKGFPESDFPDFKPHITLTYDKGVKLPKWKSEYEKEISFTIHIVTDRDYEEVYRERVTGLENVKEDYSVELSPLQQNAKRMGIDINQIVSFVPYAVIDGEDISLVGKRTSTKNQYYGYSHIEQAVERINRAKNLPIGKKISEYYIVAMFGDKIVSYYDEFGNEE